MPGMVMILQSHRLPLPLPWLEPCVASVRDWAQRRGFDYRFVGDELLEALPAEIAAKTRTQPVVATDIARLLLLRSALRSGHDCVVWLDADTLVLDPDGLRLAGADYALGREVWVQAHRGALRAYVKVHNAYLQFGTGNPFLEFYLHAALRIVERHEGPLAPQLVGPKLLTALHNLVGCPVLEQAAMLPPLVAADVLSGGGAALDLFRRRSTAAPAAVNLCASLAQGAERRERRMLALIERLLDAPRVLAPAAG
ncbi:MAG: hypothetical protein R3E86_13735 [Pseudomonadales bacterium]